MRQEVNSPISDREVFENFFLVFRVPLLDYVYKDIPRDYLA